MRFVLTLLIATAFPIAAIAQAFPAKPVRMIVPYPPGGGTDIVARALGQRFQERTGQPIIIDNRPGGSELIGTQAAARAPADGYTLLLMSNSFAINVSLMPKLPYDSEADFVAISKLVDVPFGLFVNPQLQAKSVEELIALARSRPGQLNGAHVGPGSPHFLTLEWFKIVTGTRMAAVPYKGAAPALAAVVAGEVDLIFAGLGGATPHMRAGKLRGLAVTSGKRITSAPELPTLAEAGVKDLEMTAWFGLMAPAGTPRDVLAALNNEVAQAMRAPDVVARVTSLGMESAPSSAADFAALVRRETKTWAEIVRATGAQAETAPAQGDKR